MLACVHLAHLSTLSLDSSWKVGAIHAACRATDFVLSVLLAARCLELPGASRPVGQSVSI